MNTDSKREPEVVRWHDGTGWRLAVVVGEGTKLLHVVVAGETLSLQKLPRTEERYMRPELHKGAPYPVKRAARLLLSRLRRLGGTKAARVALQQLKKEET